MEVEERRPLCGGIGRTIERALYRHCGMQRSDVHWTNAVACAVPERELAAARKCCAERLRLELEEAASSPPTTVVLGPWALQSAARLSRKPDIKKFRGAVIETDDPVRGERSVPATILPTIHPMLVMRDPLWDGILQADFARVGRVLRGGYTRPEDVPGRRTVIPRTVEELQVALAGLGDSVAVDVETNGLDVYSIDLVCFVVADQQTAVVVPWSKTQQGEGAFFNGRQPEARALVNAALACRTSITHNGPLFDFTVLSRHGIQIRHWEDTQAAYHVVTSNFPKRLSHVATCYLDVPPWKEWNHGTDLTALWNYCGRDGFYTRLAWDGVAAQMDEDDWRVYESDKRSAELCRAMGINGFAFDRARAADISTALRKREAELTQEASELVEVAELNLLSPAQMRTVFFQKLGAHMCFRTESGAPSLDVDSLRAYCASADPRLRRMAELTLEYRRVRKCRSTYVDGVDVRDDGRVRGLWRADGTETGRWSSQKPNLANLPRPENDPAYAAGLGGIRSLYIAPPGRKLAALDVGQAEFRVAAYYTNDPNMIRACSEADIHSANAALLFGDGFLKSEGAARKMFRTLAKTSGFAVCYLAEPPTVHARLLASGMTITLQKVEAMIANLRRTFRTYYEFVARNVELTIRRGYVESPLLRRKRWLGHNPEPPKVANYPIQSGTADIFNTKTVEIWNRCKQAKLDALPVAAVYDAIYFDTAERDAEAVAQIMRDVWAEPVRLGEHDVVLPIDLHIAERWSDL
jgi:uracil-DNA glycosylase family 4